MTYKWPGYPNQQHSYCNLLGWQIDCHLLQNQTFTWPFVKKVDIYTANNHILHAWFTFNKEWHIECHLLQNYTYIWTYILKLTHTQPATNFSILNPTFIGTNIYSATCHKIRHIYGHFLWSMTYKLPEYPNQQHLYCYLLGWQIDSHLLQNKTYIWPFVTKADIYTANNHLLRDFFNLTRCDI